MDITRSMILCSLMTFTVLCPLISARLHAPRSVSEALSDREKACWLEYLYLQQIHNGVETPVMPTQYRRNYLLDGDTIADYCKLLEHLQAAQSQRKKRYLFNFTQDATKKWDSNDFPIRYKFFTSGFDDESYRDNVRRAIGLIEQDTCVDFSEIPSNVLFEESHIEFQRRGSCASFVGRSDNTVPQPIYLNAICLNQWGDVTHEIMHALGMWHTHQRFDRDEHITYFSENIQDEYVGQFFKLPSDFGNTLGKRYDYSSIMHFAGRQFSRDGSIVLQTTDSLYQRTIGQRVELSFDDAHFINHAYCGTVCDGITLFCLNGGYIDPKDCSQCRCVDGFSGTTCDELSPPVQDDCGVQELTATSATAYIMSPNYGIAWYKNWQECTWRITAPSGLVQFWFEDVFGVFCENDETCFHWVEFRYGEDLTRTGPRFCCNDLPLGPDTNRPFYSNSSTMMVLFRAKTNQTTENDIYRTGFKLAYRRILAEVCEGVDCNGNGICQPTDGSCLCNDGFEGINCADQVDPCQSNPCQNNGTCLSDLGRIQCVCQLGFTGFNCESEVNACLSAPCQNGGTCQPNGNDFVCICRDGYTGIFCEEDINECTSGPCLNGGSCTDRVNGFTCECLEGYIGVVCQIVSTTSTTPTTTSTTTTTTTATTSTSTTTPALTTTLALREGECPPDRWGDECQYPKTCGGHHPNAGPGVLDTPCDHSVCHKTERTRTCTRHWWRRRCHYKYSSTRFTCPDAEPVCDSSIGFHLVRYYDIYWCAQEGYQQKGCDCCVWHCERGCSGWHREVWFWNLEPISSDLNSYELWNVTCIQYPSSNCRL